MNERIWPLDDEARVSTDKVLLGEQEQRAGPLPSCRAGAPHYISCALPRLLLHRLCRRLLRCSQPKK